jgi:hypothetical protein
MDRNIIQDTIRSVQKGLVRKEEVALLKNAEAENYATLAWS